MMASPRQSSRDLWRWALHFWLLLQRLEALSDDGLVLVELKDYYLSQWWIRGTSRLKPSGLWESWNISDPNPCSWAGVGCNGNSSVERLQLSGWTLYFLDAPAIDKLAALGSLKELDLSSTGIFESIPPEISRLTGLTYLDLSGNMIEGSIPSTINQLRSLRYLSLAGNGLGGSVPSLDQLAELQVLFLSNNVFGGPVPELKNLTNLVSLDLSRNNLSGSIPSLQGLNRLLTLNLNNNGLTGFVDSAFSGLGSLKQLFITGNGLEGPIPLGFEQLSSLQELDLSSNHLWGEIPIGLRIRRTWWVNLSGNELNGSLSDDLVQPTFQPDSLQRPVLNLSKNSLIGRIPESLLQLEFEVLDLSHNQLDGPIPAPKINSTVEVLRLQQNQLSGDIGGLLSDLGSKFTVGELRLGGNSVTGDITRMLDGYGDGPHLFVPGSYLYMKILDLSNNHLYMSTTDEYPSPLKTLIEAYSWLRELRLGGNNLTGITLPTSLTLTAGPKLLLQILDLSNSNLEGEMSVALLNSTFLPTLMELNISSNRLQGPIPASFTQMPNLTSLDVSSNSLSGQLPVEAILGDFVALQELRVASNNLTGIVALLNPTSTNRVLEVLDISHNSMKGVLPADIFSNSLLPALRLMDVSSNGFQGQVPSGVTEMPQLTLLNVSNNRLSGPLPLKLPANLWNASFFADNPRLCGGPLLPCPPPSTGKVELWLLLTVVAVAVVLSGGSCVLLGWRCRVYTRKHQQDADLIATLLGRDNATLMPLRELRKATDNFSESAQIGVGGFGTVYAGKLRDGTTVAIKRSKQEGSSLDKQQFLNEVTILSQVNHRYLVRLLGCCMENKIALLVFEYIPNGTLLEHLQGKKGVRLSWSQRLHIALQTSDALAYLHSAADPPIYHRDVKSANILLDDDLNAKVADFGISKLASIDGTHVSTVGVQGTIGYMDPEYYMRLQLTAKSDVYSFGVVLLELISAQPAVDIRRGLENASLVSWANPLIKAGDLEPLVDPVLVDTIDSAAGRESMLNVGRLAMNCLAMRSKDRPSMKDVWKQLQTLWLQLDPNSVHVSYTELGASSKESSEQALPSTSSVSGSITSSSSSIQMSAYPVTG